MNLKRLVSLVLVFLFMGVIAQAQQTFYVNNQSGNDANPGTQALPYESVGWALIAAPTGSTISVAFTGIPYTEANITIQNGETYTFVSTGGTPVFTNAALLLGPAGGATAGNVTFNGPFQFSGLQLNNGVLTNGNQVTLAAGANVTRTNLGSIASGQLQFAGTANFTYDNLAAIANTIVTGLEFPTGAGVANNLTTLTTGGGALTLRLDQTRTINGMLTTAATNLINLGGFTLNIVGSSVGHDVGGNVTNGTLNFNMNGATQITSTPGGVNLPNVTTEGTNTLTVTAQFAQIGSFTANGATTIAANNTGQIGNITNNGSGAITTNQTTPGVVGNVLMSATATATATITLNTSASGVVTTGNITQSGLGIISFGANIDGDFGVAPNADKSVLVNGNVLLNSTIPAFNTVAAVANRAQIVFNDAGGNQLQGVRITGNVTNSASFSGSSDQAANNNNGIINFSSTYNGGVGDASDVVVVGNVANNVSGSIAYTGGGGGASNGEILFTLGAANGTVNVTGTVTNSSTLTGTGANEANIRSTNAIAGGLTFTGGVSNTSAPATAANGRNDIDFSTVTGVVNTGTVSSSGAAGGDIRFGDANIVVNGDITNSRTAVGADIVHGTAGGAGTVTVNNINNSGAANILMQRTTVGNVTVNNTLTVSGTGGVLFPNATTAVFGLVNLTVSNGVLDFGDETVVAAQGNINVTGNVVLSNGVVDMGQNVGGARLVTFSGTSIQLGGAVTSVTYNNATTTTIDFAQPVPNVPQIISLGTANQVYPGPVTVTNAAVLPAPFVTFQSINGSAGISGTLIIRNNNLTFNTPTIVNSIQLDNARIYIGENDPGGSAGNFQNTSGYTTVNGGFVMMSGNAAQTVNAAVAAAGAEFGNFGVDNNSAGTPDVTFPNPATVTADFYLAEGQVDPTNLVFGGSAPNWPTIYRTEGTFTVNIAPNIALANYVNVTYYGGDKGTANEIPNSADDLWNLTVATTNGAQPGQGIVTVQGGFTVNGTLTTDALQTLYLNGQAVILNGDLVNNGLVVNSALLEPLQFGGNSTVSGTGLIPSIQINDGANVVMTSPPGLVDNYFVGLGVWSGGENATRDGNVTHQGGFAGPASSLTLNFPALTGVAPSTHHFANLTLSADGNETVILSSDVTISGNATLNSGTVDVATFTLTHQGNNFAINGANGATVIGATGKVLFNRTVDGANELQVLGGAAVIGANVEIQMNSAGDFDLTTNDLTINGNVTLLDGPGVGNGTDLALATNLTAGGANFTVNPNSQVTGAGILILDAVASNPGLTFNLVGAGNANVNNLTVNDNVTLAGGVLGNDLIVGTAFVHNAGDFNFGNADLVTNGTYTRTGGTYTGTGFLRHNGGAWNHGPALVINNIDFMGATNIGATANTLTVNDYLRLAAVVTQNAGTSQLIIGDGAGATTVEVNGGGNISNAAGQVAPTFVGQTDYLFTGGNTNPNIFTWPTAQATNVTLNQTGAINTTTVGADRTINGDLTLTTGQLEWDSPVVVTIADGSTITRNVNGSLDKNANNDLITGTLTAPNVNLVITNNVGVNGIEYSDPVIVNNLTLGLPAATTYTLVTARTISGTVTFNSTLNINANTVFAMPLTLPNLSTINVAGATTATYNNGLTVEGAYNNNGAATSTTTVVAGGLNVGATGVLDNAGIINVTDGLAVAAGGNLTDGGAFSGVWNLDGLTAASGGIANVLNFPNGGTIINLTGDATIGNAVWASAVNALANGPVVINTPNNLTFNGIFTNSYLDLNFIGTNDQTVALGANRTLNNVSLLKGNDGVVTFSGGNVNLIPAGGGNPAGVLTLTRGILEITNPNVFTLNLTVAGGIIQNLGYARNLAQATHFSHVVGKLGVAIPAGTIGRTEWPVGSINPNYRPAAITFTAGNATIAPTTIIVSHVDAEPTGVRNLPLNGGVKFTDPNVDNMIGGKAPYHWTFEATTSLGAAQMMNVELNGTNLSRPLENHNDLRIIRRFDGDVAVNGWFLEGDPANYSNAMYVNTPAPGDTLLLVRNIGSAGSAIAQRALFTIGIPTQPPVFTAKGSDDPLANRTINENDTYTFTYQANDLDANPQAIVYSVDGVTPAVPDTDYSIDSVTGDFEFTPSFDLVLAGDEDFTFVVKATKGDESSFITDQLVVNVSHVNRPPSIDSLLPDTTNVQILNEFAHEFVSSDPDAGQTLTWALTVDPTGGAATINPATGMFSWTPDTADAGNDYTFTVTVTDDDAAPLADATTFTLSVGYDRIKGDINGDGNVDLLDALLALDAAIEKIVLSDLEQWAGDMDDDGNVTLLDALAILDVWTGGPMAASGGKPTSNILSKIQSYNALASFGKLDVDQESRVIHLPVNLSNVEGIRAFGFDVELSMEVESITPIFNMPSEWLTASNYKNGKLMIGAIGLEDLASDLVLTLEIVLKDKKDKVSLSGIAKINGKEQVLNQVTVQEIPNRFDLSQNYPNPFNPSTIIKYDLAENVNVTMKIYNIAGQEVATIVNGFQEAGSYQVRWDGTNNFGSKVAAGLYIYRLEAGPFTSVKKMMLIK